MHLQPCEDRCTPECDKGWLDDSMMLCCCHSAWSVQHQCTCLIASVLLRRREARAEPIHTWDAHVACDAH